MENRIGQYEHKAGRLGWLWYKSAIRAETDKLKGYHQNFKDMIQLLSANDIREIKDSFVTGLSAEIRKIDTQMHNVDNERTF